MRGTDDSQSRPQSCRIQIDRMVFGFKMRTALLLRTPVGFGSPRLTDHPIGGSDGIRTGANLAHMDGKPAHLNLKPDDPDMGPNQPFVFRIGDQKRVGFLAAQMRHQRAIARGLLLDDRLQVDRGGRLQSNPAQRIHRMQVGGMAGLMSPPPDHRASRRQSPNRTADGSAGCTALVAPHLHQPEPSATDRLSGAADAFRPRSAHANDRWKRASHQDAA